mgnify:FL=1
MILNKKDWDHDHQLNKNIALGRSHVYNVPKTLSECCILSHCMPTYIWNLAEKALPICSPSLFVSWICVDWTPTGISWLCAKLLHESRGLSQCTKPKHMLCSMLLDSYSSIQMLHFERLRLNEIGVWKYELEILKEFITIYQRE